MNQELTYWVALVHTPKIWTSRKNEMIAHCFRQEKTIAEFFESNSFLGFDLKPQEFDLLQQTRLELPNYAFMVEELLNQGYDIVPVTSKEYSPTLKANLKYNSPIVLYTKGNKQILQEKSIAIVGSRNANVTSLLFADNVAKKATSEYKVVVSGFAKGIDKQALDSALKYKGQSIIVLPQGITTFASGIKKYYKQIIEGNVLVLSTFHPKSPWSVELAMARNSIIYGLASEIYVAQSDDKGGTWSGVCDGLKKGRIVYVRKTDVNDNCANLILINMGAEAVDMNGNTINNVKEYKKIEDTPLIVAEPTTKYNSTDDKLIELLNKGEYTTKQIIELLHLSGISSQKLSQKLKKIKDVQVNSNGKTNKYTLLKQKQQSEQLSLSL
ncbi:MAG: DNA transporter [Bacteroidetes bacterium]|nr:DNA transporter [Bacteroidota bacterium]